MRTVGPKVITPPPRKQGKEGRLLVAENICLWWDQLLHPQSARVVKNPPASFTLCTRGSRLQLVLELANRILAAAFLQIRDQVLNNGVPASYSYVEA